MPDIEFLEYLGSWEESDADWVLFSEIAAEQVASETKRTDPVSKDEESVETGEDNWVFSFGHCCAAADVQRDLGAG